ncbi:hypothetical protein ACVMB3_005742 [Sinorhizobium meliloti]|nr:hypothetical protein Sinme_4557 [Sinorhizobium meliloti AK83]MBP2468156.1 hypothetical protein [Sinorhizobium meliloti]TWB05349.1 hypothetical protein FB000_102112 [Ensifer sp. SEMIA 134]TWB41321.1 hypothetical protein FB001_101111 [Ensifer sp. SEMIA 135]CCM71794.1 hypothetical protein BN406_05512 [Sinorhizobium meliloti Rm41]
MTRGYVLSLRRRGSIKGALGELLERTMQEAFPTCTKQDR